MQLELTNMLPSLPHASRRLGPARTYLVSLQQTSLPSFSSLRTPPARPDWPAAQSFGNLPDELDLSFFISPLPIVNFFANNLSLYRIDDGRALVLRVMCTRTLMLQE